MTNVECEYKRISMALSELRETALKLHARHEMNTQLGYRYLAFLEDTIDSISDLQDDANEFDDNHHD